MHAHAHNPLTSSEGQSRSSPVQRQPVPLSPRPVQPNEAPHAAKPGCAALAPVAGKGRWVQRGKRGLRGGWWAPSQCLGATLLLSQSLACRRRNLGHFCDFYVFEYSVLRFWCQYAICWAGTRILTVLHESSPSSGCDSPEAAGAAPRRAGVMGRKGPAPPSCSPHCSPSRPWRKHWCFPVMLCSERFFIPFVPPKRRIELKREGLSAGC